MGSVLPRLRRDSSPSCEETARGIPEFRILLRDFATGSNGKVETSRRFSIRRLRARLREREISLIYGKWVMENRKFSFRERRRVFRITAVCHGWCFFEKYENISPINSGHLPLKGLKIQQILTAPPPILSRFLGKEARVAWCVFFSTTKTFSKTRILCGFGSEGGRGAHREWPSLECTRAHNDLHAHVPRIAPYREGNGSPVGCTQRN